jgi:hypothetical protein
MSENTQRDALNRTISNMSEHLDHLAANVFRVEEAIGELLDQKVVPSTVPLTKLQTLDYTRQSLEDCALLLHLISKESEGDEKSADFFKLKSRLRLKTTRDIIDGRVNSNRSSSNNDIDLF